MDNVHHDSAPHHLQSGIQEDGSVSIWNSASCCGRGREYIGKLLALEVSTGKVVTQIVSSKVSKVRILTQRRAANIVESITNVLLKYPHPLCLLN